MTASRRRRVAAAVALVAVVWAGLIVARVLAASVVTDVAGDALYAVAVFCGLVVLCPLVARARLALAAAVWCMAVELLQATGLPAALAERVPPVALVLGVGFDPRDLIVYPLAVAAAAGLDALVTARLLPSRDATADV